MARGIVSFGLRSCFAFFVAFLSACSVLTDSRAAEVIRPSSVVELFTSQGCNSCPPADSFLTELSKEPDILALAWHVDYWDYLGWKDTFSSRWATLRQRKYATGMNRRSVYTPQAIVNGREDVVGSYRHELRSAISRLSGSELGLTVPMDVRLSDGMLKVSIPSNSDSRGATLWMVYFDEGQVVKVERGENRGRSLRYSNVVRSAEMLGRVRRKPLEASFGVEELKSRGFDAYALILQRSYPGGIPGPIVGAAVVRGI